MDDRRVAGHAQSTSVLFYSDKETVTACLERFWMFVSAYSIETDKVVPTLLTVLGSMHYMLLCGLVSLEFPKDKSYNELVELMKKHYDPEPIIIAEHFHFIDVTRRLAN